MVEFEVVEVKENKPTNPTTKKDDITFCDETKEPISKTKELLQADLPEKDAHVTQLKHVKCPLIELCKKQLSRIKEDSFEEELRIIREKKEREKTFLGKLNKYKYHILGVLLLLFLLWAALVVGAQFGVALCSLSSRGCRRICHPYFNWPYLFINITKTSGQNVHGVW